MKQVSAVSFQRFCPNCLKSTRASQLGRIKCKLLKKGGFKPCRNAQDRFGFSREGPFTQTSHFSPISVMTPISVMK